MNQLCVLQSESILSSMYTHPSTAEQCLHNALKVTSALKQIGLEYDIQVRKPQLCLNVPACQHIYGHVQNSEILKKFSWSHKELLCHTSCFQAYFIDSNHSRNAQLTNQPPLSIWLRKSHAKCVLTGN